MTSKQPFLLWPNLSIDAGPQYDSNKYNYNSHWIDVGARLSWNVLKLAQLPALQKAHEHQNNRRHASHCAFDGCTYLFVGVQRYGLALSELSFPMKACVLTNAF